MDGTVKTQNVIIAGRGVLTSIFYEDPLYCLPSFFQNFDHSLPLPCCLQPLPSLLFLLSCFFGCMGDRPIFDVLFYLMTLWIYTC